MRHPRRRHRSDAQRKPRTARDKPLVHVVRDTSRAKFYTGPNGEAVQWHKGRFTELPQAGNSFAPMPRKVRRAYEAARARTERGR